MNFLKSLPSLLVAAGCLVCFFALTSTVSASACLNGDHCTNGGENCGPTVGMRICTKDDPGIPEPYGKPCYACTGGNQLGKFCKEGNGTCYDDGFTPCGDKIKGVCNGRGGCNLIESVGGCNIPACT